MRENHTSHTATRCAIYTRVSTAGQADDGTSLRSQLASCRQYAADRGWTIVMEEQDVASGGAYRDRSGLSRVRRLVRSGGVDVVLCHALDRLSRNQTHTAVLVDEIEHAGARLELVTETFDDTPVGALIRSVQAYAAELEREKITERVTRGRRERVLDGAVLPGCKVRYGYVFADDKTRFDVDPLTAPVVRRIFREYATGRSLRQLVRGLEADGIPSPTGKPHWNVPTIAMMLKEPAYVGKPVYWRHGGEAIKLPAGVVPALIDQATFDEAQRRLARNRREATRHNPNPEASLLRAGFVRCAACGWSMVVRNNTSRGNGQYICQRHTPRVTISRPMLDDIVRQRIGQLVVDENPLDGYPRVNDTVADFTAELAQIDRTLAKARREQANLARVAATVDNADSVTVLAGQLDQLSDRIRSLEDERATVAEQSRRAELRAELLADFDRWRQETAVVLHFYGYHQWRDLFERLGMVVYVGPADDPDVPRWKIVLDTLDIVYTNQETTEHNRTRLVISDRFDAWRMVA